MATADPPLTLRISPSVAEPPTVETPVAEPSAAEPSGIHQTEPVVIPEPVIQDGAAESVLASERVADYLVQVGWSRDAATQRAGRLVQQVIDEGRRIEPSNDLTRRQLVRGAMSLAIDSATSATRPHVVPVIQTRPMPHAGQAQRLRWLRLNWWLGRISG